MPTRVLDRFDRFQQHHAVLAFPVAVWRKYADDRGGRLAATIAYYGFFSLFPLLLVLVTILGYVLRGHPDLQRRVVGSALGQFPVIGPELEQRSLHGSGIALALGISAALWTGIAVLLAAEAAVNEVWGVPATAGPGFVGSRVRAFLLLLVLGGGVLVSTLLSGIGTSGGSLGIALRLVAIALSLMANFLLFWLAFRVLLSADVGWACLRNGALIAAVGYETLQLVGSYYVSHTLKNASDVYGTFGLVIGLLSWIYLTSTIFLLAAEGNVVAARRLWPRSFSGASG